MTQKIISALIIIIFVFIHTNHQQVVSAQTTGFEPVLVWEKMKPPIMPSPRFGFSLALIEPNQVALYFGGFGYKFANGQVYDTVYFNDLWLTDGTQWLEITTQHTPPGRSDGSLTFDSGRQETVLFGGGNLTSQTAMYFNDTWTFDGVDWIQHATPSAPSPRIYASLAYDPGNQRTYLFGGSYWLDDDLILMNDTWAWDGSNWQNIPTETKPMARDRAAMAYDPVHQNVLLYGGYTLAAPLGDTWTWDGDNWTEQYSASMPLYSNISNPQMVFDASRQQILMIGTNWYSSESQTETWVWDGQDWTQLKVLRPLPFEVGYHGKLVYFPKMKTVAMVGTFLEKVINPDNTSSFIERSEVWVLVRRHLQFIPLATQ